MNTRTDTRTNHGRVDIEEVSSILIPAEGVTVDQALSDADIKGAKRIVKLFDGDGVARAALIVWTEKGTR